MPAGDAGQARRLARIAGAGFEQGMDVARLRLSLDFPEGGHGISRRREFDEDLAQRGVFPGIVLFGGRERRCRAR